MIRYNPEFFSQWQRIETKKLRWVPPGDEISPAAVINDLQVYIRESKRRGFPLERAVFHGVEAAADYYPSSIGSQAYFWPTLFELLRTEGITSLFVNNSNDTLGTALAQLIEAEADFSLNFSKDEEKERPQVFIRKQLGGRGQLTTPELQDLVAQDWRSSQAGSPTG